MTEAEQLAEIRRLVAATGLGEDEGSTIGMVAGLCDLACRCCQELEQVRIKSRGVELHMESCRALLGVPDDDVLYARISEVRTVLREAIERLEACGSGPVDAAWINDVAKPLLK